MVSAARAELRHAGVTETPGVALADAGYRNDEHSTTSPPTGSRC